MRTLRLTAIGICVGMFVLAGQAFAVKSRTIKHEQPKDFISGELEDVVVSSRGEVFLARESEILLKLEAKADVVNALVRAGDGKIYAATGPKGIVFKIEGDKVSEFATLPNGKTIFSLVFTKEGNLLAGTGGEQAEIYQIDGTGKVQLFYKPEGATYVWALARGAKGEIYAATGIEGKLYAIEADGSDGRVLAEVKPKNLLCLAFGPEQMLYVGTDEDGLICRIDPETGKVFVLYDAKEPEISAVVLDKKGNVFASTADAEAARPGRQIAEKVGGRPEPEAETKPGNGEKESAEDNPDGKAEEENNGKADEGNSKEQQRKAAMKEAMQKAQASPAQQAILKAMARKKHMGHSISSKTPSGDGNAIYCIDRDGFVTEVFRKPVMILAMEEYEGILFVATGNEGRVYSVDPAEERTVMLKKLESSQVTALLRRPDGQLILGAANDAAVARLADHFAKKGTLTSEPIDAKQVVKWGRIRWKADLPEGTSLKLSTRSSNVEDKESEAWEEWSEKLDASEPVQIASSPARFLQYRLTLQTTENESSPKLRELEFAQIEENQPPKISDLRTVAASEAMKNSKVPSEVKSKLASVLRGRKDAPDHLWVVFWQSEDPNEDALRYKLDFRQVGHTRWVQMSKDLDDNYKIWDTRTVEDGRYELRVEASDIKGNPPTTELTDSRLSDPMVVDNTAPQVEIVSIRQEGHDSLRIKAQLNDTSSVIVEASYAVDSQDKWFELAADDDIFDSKEESVTFIIEELDSGEHYVALRVRDEQGNTTYVSRSGMIKP